MNKLILGDNLDSLKKLESESVDLIYLDPPFFSNRSYEVIWGDKSEIRSFEDNWIGGMEYYINWLKDRVQQMHRILKPTGSIFLHCDYHANSHIRVYILDQIFGYQNFRAEIIWKRHNAHNNAKKKLGVLTDTIWYYSKSAKFTYNPIVVSLTDNYVNSSYKYQDSKGFYMSDNITAPNINPNDIEWRGFHPGKKGRSWAISEKTLLSIVSKETVKNMTLFEKLELLYKHDFIVFTKNGTPRLKRYFDVSYGTVIGNIWTDIINVQSLSKERIGYPTQKPEALLERIIKMASNENDIVLDPFVGGGTTVAVANKLNRKWIGIDQSPMAIKVSELRLQQDTNLFSDEIVKLKINEKLDIIE